LRISGTNKKKKNTSVRFFENEDYNMNDFDDKRKN
jgi:hypothetical protein